MILLFYEREREYSCGIVLLHSRKRPVVFSTPPNSLASKEKQWRFSHGKIPLPFFHSCEPLLLLLFQNAWSEMAERERGELMEDVLPPRLLAAKTRIRLRLLPPTLPGEDRRERKKTDDATDLFFWCGMAEILSTDLPNFFVGQALP